MKGCTALLALLIAAPMPAQAPMRYVHNGPESPQDVRYLYHWAILRTALEKTTPKYGPFVLETAPFMTEARQTFELRTASKALTVIYLGTTPEMERDLIPIRIPVDRNLGGYTVFLIRKERQAAFDRVRTLDDLRRFSIGLGLGWIDVDILRASHFNVVTGSNYDGLFKMLDNDRFDAFCRAAVEVLGELDERRTAMPDVRIEKGIALYYPMPMYFWFANNSEGRRLAERAEAGMRMMIADGSYDRLFAEYQDYKIRQLDLTHRRVLRISNPFLGPETPFSDKRLWFDPATYRPGER